MSAVSAPAPSSSSNVEAALLDLMFAAEDAGESDIVQLCVTVRTLRTLPPQVRAHIAHIYADFGWVLHHLHPDEPVKG